MYLSAVMRVVVICYFLLFEMYYSRSISLCLSSAGFVAVALVSRAVRHVAAVKLVPESWMVRRPDREESLML